MCAHTSMRLCTRYEYEYVYKVRVWVWVQSTSMRLCARYEVGCCTVQGTSTSRVCTVLCLQCTSLSMFTRYEYEYVCKVRVWVLYSTRYECKYVYTTVQDTSMCTCTFTRYDEHEFVCKVRKWVCVQYKVRAWVCVQGTKMSMCARCEYEYVCKVRVWVCVQYACEEFTYFAHSLSQEKNMLNFWPDCSAQLLSQSNLISSYS